jgi:hypothetical protein
MAGILEEYPMNENVKRLWVPESPENEMAKLECLRLAAENNSSGTADILGRAKQFYEWVSAKKSNI